MFKKGMTDSTMGSDGFPATLEIAAEEEEGETAQRPKTKAAMAKSAMETSPPPLANYHMASARSSCKDLLERISPG